MFLIAGLVVGGFAWGMCKLCGVEGPHDPVNISGEGKVLFLHFI